MVQLIAKGEKEGEFWQKQMPEGKAFVLGRSSENWDVPWEKWLSRQHAELAWVNHSLKVRRLPEAKNPIWFRGEKVSTFSVKAGETFVIGNTVFSLDVESEGSVSTGDSRQILHAFTISPENLRHVPFRDAPHRLDVLGHLAKVIESAPNDAELLEQAVNLLLRESAKRMSLASLKSKPRTPRGRSTSSVRLTAPMSVRFNRAAVWQGKPSSPSNRASSMFGPPSRMILSKCSP